MSWLDALHGASGGDLDEAAPDAVRRDRKLTFVVGAVAFSMLLLEVLLARMFPFFLGDVSAFVAIPVAMLGLSLGALGLHVSARPVSSRALAVLVPALGLSTLASFVLLFPLFDHVFNVTHHKFQSPPHDALKTTVLSLLFVPPFALAGAVLSIAFRTGARHVGRLYAVDLAASALACVITPLALHTTDLPVVICLLLGVHLAANAVVFDRDRRWLAVALPAFLLTAGAASRQWVFVEHPDTDTLGVRYSDGHTVTEHAHRWNEISRVALLSWEKDGAPTTWRVLHDDGVSNVVVVPWDPARLETPPPAAGIHGLPFLLDHPPERALVLFAGAGRDMIQLLEQSRGALDVTGVEINPLVPALAVGETDPFHLQSFYALPNVHLVLEEGRSFLDRDQTTYDLYFAGSNGAETAVRSGHVRRFLDTEEAAESVLDHLAPDGTMVFFAQPFQHKLTMFARLFAERRLRPLTESVIVIGSRDQVNLNGTDTLLIRPRGFSPGEVDRIRDAARAQGLKIHYAPGRHMGRVYTLLRGPPDWDARVPTDDRPYERELSFAGFTLLPSLEQFRSLEYAQDWMKLFTLVLFTGISAVTIAVFQGVKRGGRRLPLWALGWFLSTGIAYMFAEIGLMAKLELFLGAPLYSIAVVLAAFLLANAAGSAWIGRRQRAGLPVAPWVPAVAAVIVLPLTLAFVDRALPPLVGLPVLAKAPLAVAAVAPLAAVLGAFYPLGAGLVAERVDRELVPTTFGLATLSSVLGSTVAIVAMIDVGFRSVVLWGEAIYVGVALVALVVWAREPQRS